jgi:hypothetical protein
MNKEFKALQKENKSLRDSISDYVEEWGGKSDLWIMINNLIENEIRQEELMTQ